MSSTNRGSTRHIADHYATPPDAAQLLVDHVAQDFFRDDPPVNVLVPGCGEGNFLDAVADTFPSAVRRGVEIVDVLADAARSKGHDVDHADFLTEWTPDGHYHLIIGNPPFYYADDFIKTAYRLLDPDHGVLCFLLRLNYLGGKARYGDLWLDHRPSKVYVFPLRLGFTPDGKTDSIEYAGVTWTRGSSSGTRLSWIDNRDVDNKWRGVDLGRRVDLEASRVRGKVVLHGEAGVRQETLGVDG